VDRHEALRRGREAFHRRAWREACDALSRADQAARLGCDDLERLAVAAYLVGGEKEFHASLERAHDAHVAQGDCRRAARAAFWLGLTLLFRGDTGRGTGWLTRARRHVGGVDCVEHGYLLLPLAEQQLRQGDCATARDTACEAARTGERFRDQDLVACARHVEGRARIANGDVAGGLALLDEAMLAVTDGEVSPIFTGLIYCSVIAACHEVLALGRAHEWTAALARWCADQPEMVAFTGTCLAHRAEILQLHGAWPEAMAEAGRACDRGNDRSNAHSAGAGFYRQAEIHRLRGEFAAAEACYHQAVRLGMEAQPGLALLRMAQGRHDAAAAAMHRVLAATPDPLRRALLLPAHVDILLAAGHLEQAALACRELEAIARRFDTEVLRAHAAFARAAVELAGEHPDAGLAPLRTALATWQQLEAPYEAARVRTLLGQASRLLGDDEAARLEFETARGMLQRLGAAPDVARLDALLAPVRRPSRMLTARERQVLRLVAAGSTNRQIAGRLNVSERTVDRHVSNILTNLDGPSRAAATAYAYEHALL
jgi:ATP/maltotriose-dependent transcriptional regulator MalT